ncbi:MAG: hypothetical protein SAK29_01275 [Scytonema sp. PMC 1069.18]|nr:hypothetical protein [Scytonema sp. PMC 1069.18]MEC4811906.1 hypothetical protein [Scytonema sp. PMC 1069.18]MEC4884991.1 hypothetical protein [Scytonema sp. PMC 1070.18]
MISLCIDMDRYRKTKTFRLDDLILEGLSKLAKQRNTSVNRLVEVELLQLLKNENIIPQDVEPLGETRGGDQKSSKGEE